jgi:hypothetical protein
MNTKLIFAILLIPAAAFCADGPSPTPAALTAGELCDSLGRQSKIMALAVQSRDTHTLHKLDAAVNQEIAAFLAARGSALSSDQAKLLGDMGTQATTAHHDAHHDQWDEVAAAESKFEADLKAIEASQFPKE